MAGRERTCPILSITPEERAQYWHIPADETQQILHGLDYGPTMMFVDKFHLSPDKAIGVGVLDVTEERCRDHSDILPGVYMVEAMAQTSAVLYALRSDKIGRPLFVGADNVRFEQIATVGGVLNTVAEIDAFGGFSGYAWTLRGNTVIARAMILGATTSHKALDSLKRRAAIMQGRTTPLFE